MNRTITLLVIAAGSLYSLAATADVVVTSNDFDSFATLVQSAPLGTTFSFNLGANSTIAFTHSISVPNGITFLGNNAVTFDGGSATSLFLLPAGCSAEFSGFTFQNAGDSAIYSNGLLTVKNSSFFHNHGGSGGAIRGNMNVSSCVFAYNDAANNGGAVDSVDLYPCLIENSTFFSNHSVNTGGAVHVGTGTLVNDTIFGNSAGNVAGGVENAGTATIIRSSLIAHNTRGAAPFPITASDLYTSGQVITIQKCLIGSANLTNLVNGVDGNLVGNGVSVNGFPIVNLLGALQDNGGPTQSMALLNSGNLINPAIDAGSNPDNLQFDQRGSPFTRTSGPGTDIGAFEVQVVPEPQTLCLAILGALCITAARSKYASLARSMPNDYRRVVRIAGSDV